MTQAVRSFSDLMVFGPDLHGPVQWFAWRPVRTCTVEYGPWERVSFSGQPTTNARRRYIKYGPQVWMRTVWRERTAGALGHTVTTYSLTPQPSGEPCPTVKP